MLKIYTDGSAAEIPGKRRELLGPPAYVGGWAFVVSSEERICAWGWAQDTTIGRMELTGCLKALQYAAQYDKDVHIVTDAIYVQKSIAAGRVWQWKKAGWVNSQGDVKNKDLWMQIVDEIDKLKASGGSVEVTHVKGHTGDKFNEMADGLAVNARASRTEGSVGMLSGSLFATAESTEAPANFSGGKMNIRNAVETLALEEGAANTPDKGGFTVATQVHNGVTHYVAKSFMAVDRQVTGLTAGGYFKCSDGRTLGDPNTTFPPETNSITARAGLQDPPNMAVTFLQDQVIDLFRSCMESKTRLLMYGIPSLNGIGTDLCFGFLETPKAGQTVHQIRTALNLGPVEGISCGMMLVYGYPRAKTAYQALVDGMTVGIVVNPSGIAMLTIAGEDGWIILLGGHVTVASNVSVGSSVFAFDKEVASATGVHKVSVVPSDAPAADEKVKKGKTKATITSEAPATPVVTAVPVTASVPPVPQQESSVAVPVTASVPPVPPAPPMPPSPVAPPVPVAVPPTVIPTAVPDPGVPEETSAKSEPAPAAVVETPLDVLDTLRILTDQYAGTFEVSADNLAAAEERMKELQKELKAVGVLQGAVQAHLYRLSQALLKAAKGAAKVKLSDKDATDLQKLREMAALLKGLV